MPALVADMLEVTEAISCLRWDDAAGLELFSRYREAGASLDAAVLAAAPFA